MAQLVETSGSIGQPEVSTILMVEASIGELYSIEGTFFPKDPWEKIALLQKHADAALVLLDSVIPEDLRKSISQRALYEFFRGKILDALPFYQKEAEDHLSKAVKLNPSLTDAWICLGNCMWKKGDLLSSKNCFSVALSKDPNKKILCQLSMLERSMAQKMENQSHFAAESIQHAKKAITLDVKDGNSWYNLGNAYLTSFFVTGAWDHTKLKQSLKAYQIAKKDDLVRLKPDIYFNYATVNKYLEDYEEALLGFEAAASKDPGLHAEIEVNKIILLLDKLENSLKVVNSMKMIDSVDKCIKAYTCSRRTYLNTQMISSLF